MNKGNINIITYLIIISVILIGSSILTIFIVPNYFHEYTRIINLMIWIVLFILSVPVENEHSRFKGKNDKIKTTLIIIILYYIIYFSLGLIFGYTSSPYSRTLGTVIKNIIFIVGTLLLQEYVRNKLVNSANNIKNYIFITIIFFIIGLDYSNFLANFENGETIFKFIAAKIIPGIATSIICTYLAKTGGHLLIYAYRMPVALLTVLLPIFPDVDWFFSAMLEVLVSLILFVFINYEHTIKVNRLTRWQKKKINPKNSVFVIVLVIFFVVFISGLLPYKPVAVMSNSMVPEFRRGYVVVVKKLNKDDIKNIKVGDILQYQLEESVVIHRIINIEENKGNLIVTTQGDNNDTPDIKKVEQDQMLGIVKFKIPYVGYPSVWFSEFFFKRKAIIET